MDRQPSHAVLVDPLNTTLGHKQVQRWNLPEGWVISRPPAHPALVSEADFIAAQEITVPRGPAGTAVRRYLLAGLIACGRCGRRLESCWSNRKPAYRCRHGYTSAVVPGPARPGNAYVREEQILPHLAAIAILLAGTPGRASHGVAAVFRPGSRPAVTGPDSTAALIGRLRARARSSPMTRTAGPCGQEAPAVTIGTDTTGTRSRQTRERRTAQGTADQKAPAVATGKDH